jgi:hypothetical protein
LEVDCASGEDEATGGEDEKEEAGATADTTNSRDSTEPENAMCVLLGKDDMTEQ